ncbi:MAG: sugar transferase related protein [Patescibacteria group bacterium]|nr:MAG: sugar transferase related protein [Patescibacteria group bacterium]
MKKISLICTVLNEQRTIIDLLQSIAAQSLKPNEVIIVDGGSADDTVRLIRDFSKKNPKLAIQVKQKLGNRSIGRNYAVQLATGELIAITDAGCILEKNWLKEIIKQYQIAKTPVVAGYYDSKPETDFQKAVVPYVLVMTDKIDPENFLPATRSMLIEKNLFQELGGFDEKLSDNEDYALARRLERQKIKISFAQEAVVFWEPRKTLQEFYTMIFRFARGDVFAGILRPKVFLIFMRYFVFTFFLVLNIKIFLVLFLFYCIWAIKKNKKYVGTGYKYLPLLQITSDIAVMHGSVVGFWSRVLR